VSSRKLKILLSLTCAIAVVVLLVWRVRSVVDESQSSSCKNNLKQIQLALLNYRELHGTFPPVYATKTASRLIVGAPKWFPRSGITSARVEVTMRADRATTTRSRGMDQRTER
jgi:hypothetical protein